MNPSLIDAFKQHPDIGKVLTEPADCFTYGYDNSKRHHLPDCVVFPLNTSGVQYILSLASQHNIPVTARGRATGTPGGSVPLAGGITLCTLSMDQILHFSPDDRFIQVQTGILNETVQQIVVGKGLFWPPDPTSKAFCTIGGNLAYNAAGPMAVKYGSTRDHVLGLVAVDGMGNILKTGVKTTKGVVGYDLTRLLIGSEGTLAIITEATLKLSPKPPYRQTLRLLYASIEAATHAVCRMMSEMPAPAVLEFMDNHALYLVRHYGKLSLDSTAQALLLIEIDSFYLEALKPQEAALARIATETGAIEYLVAEDTQQSQQLWAARRALSPSLKHIAPNKINEDVVVPISQVPALLKTVHQLSQESNIPIVCFGHIGNGNLHVNILYDATHQQTIAETLLAEVFNTVLTLGGTLSGEHGVGIDKLPFISQELSPAILSRIKEIKRLFDPKGILNPLKIGYE